MPAPSWGLDSQAVSRAQHPGCLRRQLVAVQEVAPGLRIAAALASAGPVPAALGDQGEAHRKQRLKLADDAVAAEPPADAATRAPHGELPDAERELRLERLDRRVERVRH